MMISPLFFEGGLPMDAFREAQRAFAGEAEGVGLKNDNDQGT